MTDQRRFGHRAVVLLATIALLFPDVAAGQSPPPSGQPGGDGPIVALSGSAIILPRDGTIFASIESASASAASDFGLDQPSFALLVADATHSVGAVSTVGFFDAGTSLVFYIYTAQFGTTYLSTEDHARVEQQGDASWVIRWEDFNDFDFNDLVTRISYSPPVQAAPDGTEPNENVGNGGDPVQTFTGAFQYRRLDLAIAGRGPSPSFLRAYSSADTRVGPLGPGWTHSYDIRLRSPGDATNDLLLVGPDGNTDRYVATGGTYTPPPAVYRTLVRNADMSFTVTDKGRTTWKFNQAGDLTAITDRYGNASSLIYDGAGNLISVSDPAGRGSLTFGYTTGRLTSVTDWATPARTVAYGYDPEGRLQTVTDREGKTTTYAYDGTSHRLTTITDARGHVAMTLTYDGSGRVQSQKDARGLVTGDATTFGYVVNPDGTRVTTVTSPPTSFEPAFNPTIVDSYSALGFITQRVSMPSSTETLTETYTYDATGNRTSVTDPSGNRTDFCYDVNYAGGAIAGSRGNLTRRIDPSPTPGAVRPVILVAYDSANNVTQVVAPKGVPSGATVTCATNLAAITSAYATDFAYDGPAVKLLSVTGRFTDPDLGLQTATAKYEYGDVANPGAITRVIPPRGNTGPSPDYTYATTITYFGSGSKAGLPATLADALGDATSYDYDAVGRLIAIVDPNGNAPGGVPADHTTTFSYDNEDRTRFVRLPAPVAGGAQLVTETRYDEVGNSIVRIDPLGQVTTYVYDERDGLFQVKESPTAWTDPAVPPAGVVTTEYAYDAAGNLTRVLRAKADATFERATDYAYDGRGLVRSERQYPAWPSTADPLVTVSTYNPNGGLATLLDPLGRSQTFGYDALDRLVSIDYSEPATADVTYAYDANGNRTSMLDGTGSTTYAYDEADRLTSVTSPGPTTVGYRYDLDGNRRTLIYPDATAVTYTFNKASQLASLVDWGSRTTSYSYRPDGSPKDATNANGTITSYAYDNAARLTSIVHALGTTTIDQRLYTLDAVGNVTAVNGGGTVATTMVSVSTSKVHGNGASEDSYMSADGRYVTFESNASNLVAGDTNGVIDVFVHDRLSETTTRVSVSGSGVQGNGASIDPAISADGRYVVFASTATNLVAGDTNKKRDIFVFDRSTATIERVSLSSAGVQGNHSSSDPVASADGRYVVFRSNASNLVTGDTNGTDDIFRRDRVTGTTLRVSVATGGGQADGFSDRPAVSEDGRYVVYASDATDLVADDTNAVRDVFLTDLATTTTSRQSVGAGGAQANAVSDDPAISGDGAIVAFESDATNLVGGDTNARKDIFVRVLVTGDIERASVSSAGVAGNGHSHEAALSYDGRSVAFDSDASNLVSGDTNGELDIFVRDRVSGTTSLVSVTSGGSDPGNDRSLNPAISGDGAIVAFESDATNLVGDDLNGLRDIFVRGPGYDASAYAYDGMYRLASASEPIVGPTTYSYDPVGNRLSQVRTNATTYTYDRADRITTAGAAATTVNAVGNLTARGSDTFAYDAANRLTTATVAGVTETYAYNGDGVRISRQVEANPATNYVNDVAGGLPVFLDDGTRKYVWGLGLAYAVSGAAVEVYHADRLGSVRAITDASGAVSATYRTDEFGVPTSSSGSSTQPFGYTGEPTDGTGLSYLRARYYDPTLGRFMSRDPWRGDPRSCQTLNGYIYVGNNPSTFADPSGLKALVLGWPSNRCADLRRDIGAAVEELAQRYFELVSDPHGLQFDHWSSKSPHPKYGSVEGHRLQYHDKQRNLANLNETYQRNCPNDPPPPAAPGRLLGEAPYPNPQLFHPAEVDPLYVVEGALLTGAGLYIAYRVVRFLPSLAPPLWWTLPANAFAP